MNHDEHDKLWELLGKASQPQPSPFFARNVVRAVRELEQEKTGFFAWFGRRWRFVALAGSCAVLAMVFSLRETPPAQLAAPAVAATEIAESPTVTDIEVIDSLDALLVLHEHNVWLEASEL